MTDRFTPLGSGRRLGLALALSTAAAAPARAEPAAITASIGDGVDAATVRARLAAELKTRVVPRPDGGACDLPCLSITIDGDSATVAFTPARGAPRGRTVELGADPAQWPVVITLLAGNVVRDEASDVLALLPAPPAPPAAALPAVAPAAPAAAAPPAEAPPAPAAAAPPAIAPHAPPAVATLAPLAPATSVRLHASASPVAEPERTRRLFGLGFVPGLSTDFTRVGEVSHFVSVDLLAGVSGGSTGVTVSGVADIERGRVSGVQLAGVVAIAREVAGFQVGGVVAVADRLDGIQAGGVAAVARGPANVQLGGVASVAHGSAGLQLGGVAAFAHGPANVQVGGVAAVAHGAANLQVAGVASVARGPANVQLGGVASVAHGTANIQVAGVVNVARRLEGLQIAPVNVARRVDGIQVGVVNVGSADGFSLGLINIVPGGRADLEATVDTSRLGTVLFRHGGRRWHNVYGVGGHPVDEASTSGTGGASDVWMYGLGFGPSWRGRSTVVDVELIGWQVNHGAAHYDGLSLLGQLRLSVAYDLGPIQLVAGGAINSHISTDARSPLLLERRTMEPAMTREVTVVTWPSAFAGLRL